jgi:hypothetical protein
MNKIIVYNPKNIKEETIPAYLNTELKKAYANTKLSYITFIFEDLSKTLKDQNLFATKYKDFMKEWNLPYVFFPYYVYFNKMLPNTLQRPNPKLKVNIKGKSPINVITAPAYGFLMLDVKRLKSINFEFNENYTELYYIQDLIQKCYENKFWISNCCFIDRFNSYEDLKELTLEGLTINSEKFNKEKAEYDKQGFKYQSVQEFLNDLKGTYNL